MDIWQCCGAGAGAGAATFSRISHGTLDCDVHMWSELILNLIKALVYIDYNVDLHIYCQKDLITRVQSVVSYQLI